MTLPPPKAAAELSERSTNAARMVPSSGFAPLAERELPRASVARGDIAAKTVCELVYYEFLGARHVQKKSGNSPCSISPRCSHPAKANDFGPDQNAAGRFVHMTGALRALVTLSAISAIAAQLTTDFSAFDDSNLVDLVDAHATHRRLMLTAKQTADVLCSASMYAEESCNKARSAAE
eukprot:scaffold70956_cov51-Phaeocystis_antarctica.AAC.1